MKKRRKYGDVLTDKKHWVYMETNIGLLCLETGKILNLSQANKIRESAHLAGNGTDGVLRTNL
jgi:hypothetical protein